MPAKIEITDADINYAERILLPNGNVFDLERRDFIKNLDTIDLQAVPGSGKTTALLAKLLILDKKLPFDDGSGVLVISHTNVAVDEIKARIGKNCSKLFAYPNYVGTIQGFVDKYLCTPYYVNRYKKRINVIDNQLYEEFVDKASNFNLSGFAIQEQNNAKRFLKVNGLANKLRISVNDEGWHLSEKLNGPELNIKKPKGNTRPENYVDWSLDEKNRVKEWCTCFKRLQLRSGILCFDDAYTFGEYMISHFPRTAKILQARFRYVFVDEMQDMAQHQYEILEKLFFSNNTSLSCYQRIGDKNQAIFDGRNVFDGWIDRANVLRITGSHRLSAPIANLVSRFAVSPIEINGCHKNQDGSDIDIKPCIIVYDDLSQQSVVHTFAEIVSTLISEGKIPSDPSNAYTAIGWRREAPDAGKIAINSYFPSYVGSPTKSRIDHNSLNDYLRCLLKEPYIDLGTISNQIINGLLRILRLESIFDIDGRVYTKTKLLRFLGSKDNEVIDKLRLLLYQWSRDIAKGVSVIEDVKSYLSEFLGYFDKSVNNSVTFINAPLLQIVEEPQDTVSAPLENIYSHNGIDINVCTIHSVKGTTNTATLVLETYLNKKHESERLKKQINGSVHGCGSLTGIDNSTAKMVYVGFSRPTHLLAFAVHKSRFTSLGINVADGIWTVKDISTSTQADDC